ncbi:hypothetical protein [Streptomyces sp. NPDC052107]|uniref:hypothetical protein n=1 Tax=Streptomyces sp. NPDC052107 TaxID=3155632 RepID=UPI00342A92D8
MSAADKATSSRRPPTFGPEPWPHTEPTGEWSYWDVWFAVACVVDCGGDWDDFDARLTRERSGGVMRGVYLEPLYLAAGGRVVRAPRGRGDLDLVETLACALHSEYASARWYFRAREIQGLRAYAQVAAGAVDRFTATAAVLGSEDWQPLEAMVSCALRQSDAATAHAVLRAADQPGFHQDLVRRRAIELDRELHREGHA